MTRLSRLVQSLQEERASVALNMFINRTSSLDTLDDLQQYVKIEGLDIKEYSFRKVKTDNKSDFDFGGDKYNNALRYGVL